MRHPTRRRRRWSLEGSALQLSLKAPPPKLALPYQTNRRWSQEGSALQAFSPSRVKAAVGRRVPVLGAVVGRLIPGAVGSPSCLPWGGRPPSPNPGRRRPPKTWDVSPRPPMEHPLRLSPQPPPGGVSSRLRGQSLHRLLLRRERPSREKAARNLRRLVAQQVVVARYTSERNLPMMFRVTVRFKNCFRLPQAWTRL